MPTSCYRVDGGDKAFRLQPGRILGERQRMAELFVFIRGQSGAFIATRECTSRQTHAHPHEPLGTLDSG